MGIGIDADDTAVIEGSLVPAPIEIIKPPRMSIDLDGDAVFRAGFEDLLDVDLVSGSAR